jgi:hypothetical protein
MVKSKFALLVLALSLLASSASADIVPFQWSTSGSFTGNPNTLSFTGVTNKTGQTATNGTLNGIELGTFGLTNLLSNFNTSGSFTLTVVFSVPGGVAGDNTYSASFAGDYNITSVDTAQVTFSETSNNFTFNSMNGTPGSGSFSLALANATINLTASLLGGPDSEKLYGNINGAQFTPSAAAVPEPGSVLLFGTVLAGVGLIVRKKMAA